jgi:hypothetical protein
VEADTVLAAGILPENAFRLFSQETDIPRSNKKTTAWVKQPGEEVLRLPEDLARFLPAIDQMIGIELLNLPDPALWKYFRIRAALESHVVPKNTQQRLGNKPHQDVPRDAQIVEDSNPPLPGLSTTIYTVTDHAPTIFFKGMTSAKTESGGKTARQYIDPVSFPPGTITVYSGHSWHLPGKMGGHDQFRNFLALQIDIDRELLAEDMKVKPKLRTLVSEWLKADAPRELHVPGDLHARIPVARHDPQNIYNYPEPR